MGSKAKLVDRKYLLPFVLITSLFALWGFANDLTNPMVAVFQTVMEISAAKASLIQFAFYGGYFTMAIPAALFIRKYSYKSAILLGLGLYAVGAFLFIPAAAWQKFSFFCVSLYVLTFGLAFLETTANPYILSLGARESATRRLNLAQTFNPLGSLCGMGVASFVVLPQLLSDKRDSAGNIIFPSLTEAEKAGIRLHDLAVIRNPYVIIGIVVLAVAAIIAVARMPRTRSEEEKAAGNTHAVGETLRNLWRNRAYRSGVVTQIFYVAAQIMVWTFIIQYADSLGINKATAQRYNIVAMTLFLCSRFISTMLMKYFNSRRLLGIFGVCAAVCSLGAMLIVGRAGLWCLVSVSFFMSLMFPTIYGIALENVDSQDTTLGASFLVMAIVGGALMPPLQGAIIDLGTVAWLPAVNFSFILPLVCFAAVATYGFSMYRNQLKENHITP